LPPTIAVFDSREALLEADPTSAPADSGA